MKINDKFYLEKKAFVAELSKLLNIAKPHLTCEFKLGEELPVTKRYTTSQNEEGSTVYTEVDYQPSGEFVIVNCKNGYKYEINVTADSLAAIAEEVFRAMVSK